MGVNFVRFNRREKERDSLAISDRKERAYLGALNIAQLSAGSRKNRRRIRRESRDFGAQQGKRLTLPPL